MPNYTSTLSMGKPTVILGDLNYDLMKCDQEFSVIGDFCSSMNLFQVISEPTKITDRTILLIDVILVSDDNLITESGVTDIGISDHSLVYCTLNMKIPKAAPSYILT